MINYADETNGLLDTIRPATPFAPLDTAGNPLDTAAAPAYPNARDCEHGQLRRSCEVCGLQAEIARLREEAQTAHSFAAVADAAGYRRGVEAAMAIVDKRKGSYSQLCDAIRALLDDTDDGNG